MYKYIILGSGKQGTAIAYDLARFGDASKIILADINSDNEINIFDVIILVNIILSIF